MTAEIGRVVEPLDPGEPRPAAAPATPRAPVFPAMERGSTPLPIAPARSPVAETLVQVTIGRIEVRAAAPAAATSRPVVRDTSNSTTLDDYLNRRNGTER